MPKLQPFNCLEGQQSKRKYEHVETTESYMLYTKRNKVLNTYVLIFRKCMNNFFGTIQSTFTEVEIWLINLSTSKRYKKIYEIF